MTGYVYVYGVRRSGTAAADGEEGIGGRPVDEVVRGSLTAIVSDVDEPRIRASRRELLRHTNVLAAAFAHGQVLPFRFGTLYRNRDDVASSLLEARGRELEDLLAALETKVELSVKAFYDEQAILTEVVRADPAIARLREATMSRPAAATHALKLDLGQAVARALEERRAADAETILARLRPIADTIGVDEQQVETLVVKVALLVDRERVREVDEVMDELAREQRGRIQFKYVGPLPPHSFVAIDQPQRP